MYLGVRHPAPQQNDPRFSSATGTEYCDLRAAGLITDPIPNEGPGAAATIWILIAMSTVFIALRIYCKIWRARGLRWDDCVLVLSWSLFLAMGIICQRVIHLGFGKYPCDISPQNLTRISFEGGGIGSCFTILAIVWSKTSFGITILRLTNSKLKAFVWGIVVTMNVAMCLQAVFVWVKCDPVYKNWIPAVPGKCWDLRVSNGYAVFSGVFSGVCDVVFALLPWHLVWSLKIQKKEKLGVIIAMSMGVFAGITSFVKSARLLSLGSKNFSHDGTALLTWAAAEISTTMMASCIPVLRVLFRELHESSMAGSNGGSGWRRHHGSTSSAGDVIRGKGKDKSKGNGGGGGGGVVGERGAFAVVDGGGERGDKKDDGGGDNGVAAAAPEPPSDTGEVRVTTKGKKTASEKWGSYWNFGNSSRGKVHGGKGAVADAAHRRGMDDDSSERVLVEEGGGQGQASEVAARRATLTRKGPGFIVKTHQFEVKYEGRRSRDGRDVEAGYELGELERKE